jgi:hypothetical protein
VTAPTGAVGLRSGVVIVEVTGAPAIAAEDPTEGTALIWVIGTVGASTGEAAATPSGAVRPISGAAMVEDTGAVTIEATGGVTIEATGGVPAEDPNDR